MAAAEVAAAVGAVEPLTAPAPAPAAAAAADPAAVATTPAAAEDEEVSARWSAMCFAPGPKT
eukprot:COSAG04_NODE_640_length_11672_cov_32.635358_16_plen_62_part_00